MSFTTTRNNSLKLIHTSLPETLSKKTEIVKKTENVKYLYSSNKNFNSSDKTFEDDLSKDKLGKLLEDDLSKDMLELMKNASWEFDVDTKNSTTKTSSKKTEYGKEIDIYSLVCNDNDEKDDINIYDIIDEYRKNYVPIVNITPLSISVQSAKAKMTTFFNSFNLARTIKEYIDKNDKKGKKSSIAGVYFKDKETGEEFHAGIIKKPNPRKKGSFPNGISVLIPSPMGTGRNINLKIFKNGSNSMTGCKIKEDGIAAVKILEQFILKQKKLFEDVEKQKSFRILNFETTMVNSNYSIGFKIDRTRLFELIQEFFPRIFVSYDPARYAAVKMGFYYNSIKDGTTKGQDGICECPNNTCTLDKSTSGKGCGHGINQCKKVTVAFFESGNIVITGGRNIKQANVTYEYVNKNIIRQFAKKIVLINIEDICK